jgi:5-methylcytosine-specific restriction enzyme A
MPLKTLGPRVAYADLRTARLPPKQRDPLYVSEQYKHWRDLVLARAGRQCEAIDARGLRCTKSYPEHRMFADHIREIADGGAKFDVRNGQCLCGQHHTLKTITMRTQRFKPR